jgi:hypothetical protein
VQRESLFLEQRPENFDHVMGALEDLPAWNSQATTDEIAKTLTGAPVDDLRHANTADGSGAHGARLRARVKGRDTQCLLRKRSCRSTDEVELRMASRVVLLYHRVARREDDLAADDEDGAKGLVAPVVSFFREHKSVAEKGFVGHSL